MSIKKPTVIFILIFFLLGSLAVTKNDNQDKGVVIPTQVTNIFNTDAAQKNVRNDIPIAFHRTYYFLFQQKNLYAVFLYSLKNKDLGLVAENEGSAMVSSELYTFVRFYKKEKDELKEIVKEIFLPLPIQENREGYDPEKSNLYSMGYPLPMGDYTMALAVTMKDYKKIGTAYADFSLPDFSSMEKKLETTPIIAIKSLKQIQNPATRLIIYKNGFTLGRLFVDPKLDNVFTPGSNIDLFFLIIGGQNDPATQRPKLEINYSIMKDKKIISKFSPQKLSSRLVSQPLPLVTNNKQLETGHYEILIEIIDSMANISRKKIYPFEVK